VAGTVAEAGQAEEATESLNLKVSVKTLNAKLCAPLIDHINAKMPSRDAPMRAGCCPACDFSRK
jgi:hypothetical protein